MPLSKIIPAAVVDSTNVSINIFERISNASDMTLGQLIAEMIDGLIRFGLKLALAILVFVVGRWVIGRIKYILNKIFIRRQVDLSLRSFLQSLTNITLTIVLIIIIVSILGINTTSIVALFASAGVAIGLALSGTLQNFAGGVMVLFFKPYVVGDVIEAQGQTGTVKEIQIFNTLLTTFDNKLIFIPNGGLSTGIINNYSRQGMRRVDWTISISYGENFETAKEVLQELVNAEKRILHDPAPVIYLHSLGASTVNITMRCWVKAEEYWDVYFSMNETVYRVFNERNISFPFPQLDVHVKG